MSGLDVGMFPFLETQTDTRETWFERLEGCQPTLDKNGYLSGEFGRAIVAAVRYEHSHPNWNQMPAYQGNGPAGYVGEYMGQRGFEQFRDAGDKLEDRTKTSLDQNGEGLSAGPGDPEVWSTPICEPAGYHSMMEGTFMETFWISVCMCCGSGVGTCGDPCCLTSSKVCCVESATYTEDCWGDSGPCFTFQKMCCLVTHQTPWPGGGPEDGAPCCACCNMRCGGEDDEELSKNAVVNTSAQLMKEAFLCYYCLCCGCGLSLAFPLIKVDQKCCCIRSFGSTASCWPEDRGICYKYEKMCCCVNICTFPCGGGKYDGIPACACCGMKCGGEADKDSSDSDGF